MRGMNPPGNDEANTALRSAGIDKELVEKELFHETEINKDDYPDIHWVSKMRANDEKLKQEWEKASSKPVKTFPSFNDGYQQFQEDLYYDHNEKKALDKLRKENEIAVMEELMERQERYDELKKIYDDCKARCSQSARTQDSTTSSSSDDDTESESETSESMNNSSSEISEESSEATYSEEELHPPRKGSQTIQRQKEQSTRKKATFEQCREAFATRHKLENILSENPTLFLKIKEVFCRHNDGRVFIIRKLNKKEDDFIGTDAILDETVYFSMEDLSNVIFSREDYEKFKSEAIPTPETLHDMTKILSKYKDTPTSIDGINTILRNRVELAKSGKLDASSVIYELREQRDQLMASLKPQKRRWNDSDDSDYSDADDIIKPDPQTQKALDFYDRSIADISAAQEERQREKQRQLAAAAAPAVRQNTALQGWEDAQRRYAAHRAQQQVEQVPGAELKKPEAITSALSAMFDGEDEDDEDTGSEL